MTKLKCVAISDTHGWQPNIPDADIIFHTGDWSGRGTDKETKKFIEWFSSLPQKHKICCAGNHDVFCEKNIAASKRMFKSAGIIYLLNESVTVEGVKIYGSPYQPEFYGWGFNLPRGGEKLKACWELIPENLDVLLTHGPPYGILDTALSCDHAGDELLLEAIKIKKPKYHIFGHIHREHFDSKIEVINETTFINAATCNDNYKAVNKPIQFEIEI